jgi:hypothetical protein
MFGKGDARSIGMQTAYDMWHARRTIDLRKVPTLTVAILVEPLIERPRRESPDTSRQIKESKRLNNDR